MESIRVVTIKRHSYCGKVRMQGEEYYVDNKKHLAFLEAIKKVRRVETKLTAPVVPRILPKKLPDAGKYEHKDMRPGKGSRDGVKPPGKKDKPLGKKHTQAPGQNADKKKD